MDDGIQEGPGLLPRGLDVETDLFTTGVDPSQSPESEILRYVDIWYVLAHHDGYLGLVFVTQHRRPGTWGIEREPHDSGW